MTNKEAIEILQGYKSRLTNSCSNLLDDDIEAFNIAIKAMHIVDIIKEELSPAHEDITILFDNPYFDEIQERADKRS